MKRRILSIITVLALCLSMLPAQALAAEPETDDSLCPHHLKHTAECGYIAPTEGTPCQHEHTAGCWRAETLCVHTHTEECYSDGALPAEGGEKEADACAHICTEESGCITSVPNCQHEHDETCGYTPADPGQPCGYACRICPVQELIDALPDADSITADNRAEVETRLDEIDTARAGLTDEEAEQLNVTRYQAAVSALSAQDGQAGADVPVLTEGSVSYRTCDENGQNWGTATCTSATVVAASDTAWGGDNDQEYWYVVNDTVEISTCITVTGNVHLILADGCHLNATKGINVGEGNSLTIYAQSDGEGMGTMTATGGYEAAGIGGNDDSAGGTITINGGTVTATGGDYAAGIGGNNDSAGGTITINGGTVTATGGYWGAGIGGGVNGDGGKITINGGTVMATGGPTKEDRGAGIGGGANGDGGTITINGGTVTATGTKGGAGIGGGDHNGSTGGTITINGGTVTASGGLQGAGIGGGYGNGNSGGTITINGGTVTANGGYWGAGIGGGQFGAGGTIAISGGTVTASGGLKGAGIGGGFGDGLGGGGGTITISGGTVTASGGTSGAGIGGGETGDGGTITVSGGIVTANGRNGAAGIGGGNKGAGGTFKTDDGNAVIFANSISDKTNKDDWNGVIFEENAGEVYGDSVTMTTGTEIPAEKTLTIDQGQTLTIDSGVTLTNNGTISNNGTIVNNGTINGTGTITGNQPVMPASYLDCDSNGQNWETKVCNSATMVAASDTTWGGSDSQEYWYVVNGDISNSNRITVTGDVRLILADGCHLNLSGGIHVSDGNSLTIYAQGVGENMGTLTVNAQGMSYCAGIGGNDNGAGGTITINGGTVTVTGGYKGAGIGGGDYGAGGIITINGGTVTATGGNKGAGIGSGEGGGGGTITINGGTVVAAGGDEGAGIGGGDYGAGGTITINGGTVTATGGNKGAGIGGGYCCFNVTITISGGTVTAIGTDGGTGIGCGSYYPTYGTFSTGTDGDAIIFASNILGGTADKTDWNGIIFEGNEGAVYGDITLAANAEIPVEKTLTIDEGQTLTIDGGVTLTNSGTIIVKGELKGTVSGTPVEIFVTLDANGGSVNPASATVTYNSAYGDLPTPTQNGYIFDGWYTEADGGNKIESSTVLNTTKGHTLYAHWTENKSAVVVTFSENPTYGGQLTITATVQAAPANTMLAAAVLDTMDFYLGTTADDSNKLGTASVSNNTASLTMDLTGEKWKPGNHTITAVFSGSTQYTGSTGSGTVAIAKANNSITDLTCADVVHGGTPNPSATATHPEGGITYTYSNQQNGTYGAWNTQNHKGTWYVKASVASTDYYEGAEAVTSFSVIAEREPTPSASINYTDETLTGLTAGASYSITPADGAAVTVAANTDGTLAIQEGWFGKALSIVKVAQNSDYSDSEAQGLSIPSRPAAPTTPLKLTKTANSITITNAYSGCEFSADGTSWNDTGAFTGLTAGTAYSVQVRVKATASSFRSASMTHAVTTVNGDGSTTVKPGETVTTGGGATITNDGDKTTIESGGKTTTITPPGDGGTEMDGDGTITVPEGGTVQIGNNPATTITPPPGGEVKPTDDGGVTVPGGTIVKTGDGPEITVGPGNGGTVGDDGTVTVPEGGTVQIGNNPATTITPPPGGEVKPTGDGGVTVPEGTTIKTGDGPEITVGPGNGGTVGGDGGVTVPGGGTVQVGDDPTITITLPTGGGTVTPAPGGGVGVPGGSTVTDGDTTTTIPSGGGIVDPDTGEVTFNVHTVTFDSQGGSAVSSQTVTAGGKATKPSDPARSGYNFGGWYKESACTTAWNFATDVVTGNITLYAKWTAKPTSGGGGGGTYTPPTYPPTVEKPSEGGTVTVSPSRPGKGDKVTVRPKPDDGYEVDKITVTDKDGKPVTVTKNPDGTYSFTQPSGTVKVEVSYKPIETTWNNPFVDVSEGAWYYDAVRYVSVNGLMGGYGDGRFGPNDNLTRAQLAQILFNREGRPGVNYLLQFGDVASGAWYTEAIRWATSQGIVSGYGNGRFGPNDNITREQLAVMLWRYAGSPAATNKELHFNDTDEISGFALDAMRWAVENGIISGYGNGQLGPQGLATRAQVAAMLQRFFQQTED